MSDGSVDERNVKSFKEKVWDKLENARGYFNVQTNYGRYRCPYHHNKPPSGWFNNLFEHWSEMCIVLQNGKLCAWHRMKLEIARLNALYEDVEEEEPSGCILQIRSGNQVFLGFT